MEISIEPYNYTDEQKGKFEQVVNKVYATISQNLFDDDYSTVIDYTSLYNNADASTLRVLDIFRAPKAVLSESVNPTCFSLVVDGKYYAYSYDKFEEILEYI